MGCEAKKWLKNYVKACLCQTSIVPQVAAIEQKSTAGSCPGACISSRQNWGPVRKRGFSVTATFLSEILLKETLLKELLISSSRSPANEEKWVCGLTFGLFMKVWKVGRDLKQCWDNLFFLFFYFFFHDRNLVLVFPGTLWPQREVNSNHNRGLTLVHLREGRITDWFASKAAGGTLLAAEELFLGRRESICLAFVGLYLTYWSKEILSESKSLIRI